jgi:hypothetical protein
MCNDKLERSKAKENCMATLSLLECNEPGGSFIYSSLFSLALHILSATYGDLSDPKYTVEVTQQLQDMCDKQVRTRTSN